MYTAYFLSRHEATVEQLDDMLRICKDNHIDWFDHIRDVDNNTFKQRRKTLNQFKTGSMIFLVGTTQQSSWLKKLGYTVIRPKFKGRLLFSHHVKFIYATTKEVRI